MLRQEEEAGAQEKMDEWNRKKHDSKILIEEYADGSDYGGTKCLQDERFLLR